jgi:hypothetical protein
MVHRKASKRSKAKTMLRLADLEQSKNAVLQAETRPSRERQSRTGRRMRGGNDLEADFWPASESAIKCRIRSAVTQAEAAIAIASSPPR